MRRAGLAISVLAAALAAAAGCLDNSTDPAIRKPASANQIYFDVTYANQAWGYVLQGWFVDDRGGLYHFDHGDRPIAVADSDTIKAADLLEKYSRGRQPAGQVDPDELARMRALVAAAAAGEVTPLTPTGCADAGTVTYQAWRLVPGRGAYARVLIHEKGDLGRRNRSVAADTLRAWLDKLTEANFPGCEPK